VEEDEACLIILARPVRFDGDPRAMERGNRIAREEEGCVGHVEGRGFAPEIGFRRGAEVEGLVQLSEFLHGLLVRVGIDELECVFGHL